MRTLPLIVFCCLGAATPLWARAKTDVVFFVNGDRLTCEIKKLARGKLTVSTIGMGTVHIEWEKINHVASAYLFQVELESGRRYVGSITPGEGDEALKVVRSGGTVPLTRDTVVEMTPIEPGFFAKMDGSIDVGYDFTQASSARSWNLAAQASYRSRVYLTEASYDSLLKQQEGAETVNRQAFDVSVTRFLEGRWYGTLLGQLDKNANQALELRGLVGGGLGRQLVQTNRTQLGIVGGAAFSRESYEDSEGFDSNGELVAALRFETFRFDTPELDITADFVFLPNVKTAGRYRLQASAKARLEVIKDFFWSVSFYETFDSDPPSAVSQRNDLGVTTSFGWSF